MESEGAKACLRTTLLMLVVGHISPKVGMVLAWRSLADFGGRTLERPGGLREYVWGERISQLEHGIWSLLFWGVVAHHWMMSVEDQVMVLLLLGLLMGSVGMFHGALVSSYSPSDPVHKVFHQSWQLLIHVVCSAWALSIVGPRYLIDGTLSLENECAQDEALRPAIHDYMLAQLAIWIFTGYSCLHLEHKRKDFRVMMGHHVLTILMTSGCMLQGYELQGLAMMLVHDFSDIWLDVAKLANYLGWEDVASVTFGITTLLVWPWLRLHLFASWFLHNMWLCNATLVPALPLVLGMCVVLYCLHWWWWGLMLKVLGDVALGASTVATGEKHYE